MCGICDSWIEKVEYLWCFNSWVKKIEYVWQLNKENSIYGKPLIGIGIPTQTCVCLEVNTHTETLDYFMNDKHIKDCVVNIPKDVYFGVWYFICYLFLFIDMKILKSN
jgi:hypothetical protein